MERTLGADAGGGDDGEGGGVGGGAEGGDTAGGVAKAPVAVLETPFAWQRRGRKDDEEGSGGCMSARSAEAGPTCGFRCCGWGTTRGVHTQIRTVIKATASLGGPLPLPYTRRA